jgi:hypothetical protein
VHSTNLGLEGGERKGGEFDSVRSDSLRENGF